MNVKTEATIDLDDLYFENPEELDEVVFGGHFGPEFNKSIFKKDYIEEFKRIFESRKLG